MRTRDTIADAPTASTPAGPGGLAGPAATSDRSPSDARPRTEAPRPAWVHAAPTASELLRHAEEAVGDRYRIESIAGEGGMGRVFSARDTRLGRRVAIKLLTVLDPNPGEDPGLQAHDRLVAEARAMARLNHPGLCRVIEVSLLGHTPFLVMDWVDGVPLSRHCRNLAVRQRVTVLLQILDAVARMHDEGLVHGDLKPANVLIDREGHATIVDFGLARAEADPSWIAAPRGGTPGYAAPELMSASAPVGPAADVFAAGVMLYELLTGRAPFPRNTAPAVMLGMLERGAIALPEQHAPDTPADLQKICLAAMEPDPENRYPDAAAMAADIRRYLRRETVAARPRILTARFDEQIEGQLGQAREWHRLGLITPREHELVARVLGDLQRSESPWIIDARRLRASQVALYLGGWALLIGLAVGLANVWPLVGPVAGIAVAWSLALAVLALGLRLQATGEKRVGVGMTVTAQLALPAAFWLTVRHLGWLAGPSAAGTAGELTARLNGQTLPGLANAQILALGLFALALAIGLRRTVRSAAFTFFAVVAAAVAWLAVYLVLGGLDAPGALPLGRWGAWLALLGLATLPAGLLIDAREHELIRELGRRRAKRRDAAPVLCGSLAWLGAGLSAAALFLPEWYLLRPPSPAAPPPQGGVAFAFLVNGGLVALTMVLLARRPTPLRRRLTEILRWLLPTALLLPLLFMEVDAAFGVWLPWLVALPIAAVGFCLAAALRQWKPFLFSGLVYLALWYARCFARIAGELGDSPGWRIGLTAAALVLGPALMLIAWRAPAWIASRRLQRWADAAAYAPPTGRAARTWR